MIIYPNAPIAINTYLFGLDLIISIIYCVTTVALGKSNILLQ